MSPSTGHQQVGSKQNSSETSPRQYLGFARRPSTPGVPTDWKYSKLQSLRGQQKAMVSFHYTENRFTSTGSTHVEKYLL